MREETLCCAIWVISNLCFFSGCATDEPLRNIDRIKDCPAWIEGTLISEGIWSGDYPAITVKTTNGDRTYVGESLEVEDGGIMFDPNPLGLFRDDPARLIPYEEILFAIDEDYRVVYGSPPTALSMNIELASVSGGEPVVLTLRSQLTSKTCIEPGQYQVTAIQFWNMFDYVEQCVTLPKLTMQIQPGKVNDIGMLYLDNESMQHSDRIELPYKIARSRKGRPGAPVTFVDGFGNPRGIGVAVRAKSFGSDDGTHILTLSPVNHPKSQNSENRVFSPLREEW